MGVPTEPGPGPPRVVTVLSWKGAHEGSSPSISEPLLGVSSTCDSLRDTCPSPNPVNSCVLDHRCQSLRSDIPSSSVAWKRPTSQCPTRVASSLGGRERPLPPEQKQFLPLTGEAARQGSPEGRRSTSGALTGSPHGQGRGWAWCSGSAQWPAARGTSSVGDGRLVASEHG